MVRQAAITGFGEFIEKESSLTLLECLERASSQALEMAGIERDKVDGLITTSLVGTFDPPPFRSFWGNQVAHFLGLKPTFLDSVEVGGPSFEAFIVRAMAALEAGLATTVLCVGGGKGSVRKKGLPEGSFANSWFSRLDHWVDFKPTSDYAMLANLHASRYGTKDEQRAKLAVEQRRNAAKNPRALYEKPITVKDVLSSPVIASPLHLLEIVPAVDGAHAFIVTSRLSDVKTQPVYVLGCGEFHDPTFFEEREDLLDLPLARSGKSAFKASGLKPDEMDFAQLYDSYTITTLLELEDMGFCEKGKVGRFIDSTDFTVSGDLPLNTGGGSLNVGQPGFMSGGVILAEALRQLMGLAGNCQVNGAITGLVNGVGGNDTINTSVTLILTNRS